MKESTTNRGFKLIEFKDSSGVGCNVQQSSSADQPKIWLGAEKLDIKEFESGKGWADRPEFDVFNFEHHFVGNNRMHLTQDQVKELLPYLNRFAETGELFSDF